eukprot:2977528-Prymnesium_polylepis.1
MRVGKRQAQSQPREQNAHVVHVTTAGRVRSRCQHLLAALLLGSRLLLASPGLGRCVGRHRHPMLEGIVLGVLAGARAAASHVAVALALERTASAAAKASGALASPDNARHLLRIVAAKAYVRAGPGRMQILDQRERGASTRRRRRVVRHYRSATAVITP